MKPEICFDTEDPELFRGLKELFNKHGWGVLDRSDKSPEEMCTVPRLIHQVSTLETTNTMRCLFRTGLGCGGIPDERNGDLMVQKKRYDLHVPPSICCALLDEHEGLAELTELADECGYSLSYICSAEIYCDLFAEVRHMIRKGHSPRYIQQHLDAANLQHDYSVTGELT